MAQYLLLDKDRVAVNATEWDGVSEFIMPEGAVGFVRYDGVFASGWAWDGEKLVDPNPPVAEIIPSSAGGPDVVA